MNKINKKLNKFFKKVNIPFTFISLFLCVAGIVFKEIDLKKYSDIMFIGATIFTGLPILHKAIQSLLMKIISIELLVSIAVIGALVIKEYSEAGIVTFLFQFGALLELITLEKTRKEIKSLINLAPKTALKINSGIVEEIDVDDVNVSDIILVKTGSLVPVDGEITKGEGFFIESSITGEAKPVKKGIGDYIYAGSILDNGIVEFKALKVGEDTTFNKIIALVEEAQDAKSKVERFIDKFSKYYTPFVILLALLVLLIKRIFFGVLDIDTSITILVLACPGALVIGVPVSSVAGIGKAAKNHIILKGGDSLYTFAKTDTIVLDKTGTLTKGNTKVISFKYFGEELENDLRIIQGMEKSSNHPLSKAILEYKQLNDLENLDVETLKGIGLKYQKENDEYFIGGERLILDSLIMINDDIKNIISEIKNNGSTLVIYAKNKKVLALYEVSDEIKDNAKDFIKRLKKQGIKRIIMLTGDNESVARYVAKEIGIDEYYANLLPDEKLNKLKELRKENHIITFIGDGVNDSPALAYADTGIAMGSGTDVAIETSDVILIMSNLLDVIKALKYAKKTVRVSYQNILIAVLTVLFLLAGLFIGFIHMSIGMLVHEGSILIVIFNAMRLLFIKGEKNEKNYNSIR